MTRKRHGGKPGASAAMPSVTSPLVQADPEQLQRGASGRVDRWVNRYTAVVALLTFLGTALASIAAGKKYLDSQVGQQIATRLKFYEEAAVGWALNQSEDHEEAVPRFLAAMNDPRFPALPAATKNLVRDGLILAATGTTRPVRLEAEIKNIETNLGGELEHTGWRHQQFGWYYLRSGNASAARAHFGEARKYYDLDRERLVGAEALRGLMYVALAEGRPEEAFTFARDAARRSPVTFALANLRPDLESMQHDAWIIDLKALYPQTFAKSVERLLALASAAAK
jgi:tetratricopeptide (TPR) repeat protein